jgi:two-component system sensor histidine kinase UhpB
VSDPQLVSRFQTFKGWGFVLFTGWLLFVLIRRYARERELFSRTLVESQERLQMVASATNDVVWDWNLTTNALWWNRNYFSLFGHSESETIPDINSWYDHLHPDDKERVVTGIHRVIESGGNAWSDEYRYRRADGSWAHIFDRGFVIRDAEAVARRMVGSMQDITTRKEAEEQLLQSQDELRKLAAYVESAREEERTRIAREIHDELGQSMTALKMDVSWLEKKLAAESPSHAEKTQEMIRLIDSTIRSIRRIATELRPGVLDNLGIQAAVEWQAQEFEHHTGIRCTISFEPQTIELDDLRSTALFRILQETLTNVARHAQATEVHIALSLDDARATLEIRDNGIGIAKNHLAVMNSFGIIGIRERVSHFGGSVSFSGTPGKGTDVRIILPLGKAA